MSPRRPFHGKVAARAPVGAASRSAITQTNATATATAGVRRRGLVEPEPVVKPCYKRVGRRCLSEFGLRRAVSPVNDPGYRG